MQKVRQKQQWLLSTEAFDALLRWLDEGTDSMGEGYLEMRRRLVAYFDRRNCAAPEELADETLNRVARRLEEEGSIVCDAPAQYCYIVARFVSLEQLRERKDEVPLNELLKQQSKHEHGLAEPEDDMAHRERLLSCLEQCTATLEPMNRDLIIRYYHGEQRSKIENRRALALGLGITVNALSIRACRIRDKLEACVRQCLGRE